MVHNHGRADRTNGVQPKRQPVPPPTFPTKIAYDAADSAGE